MSKYKVLDIRGTHGSGKSFVPHQLLNTQGYVVRPWVGHPLTYEGKPQILGYYLPELNLTIIGKYETACGGCDGIKTQAEIKARVEEASKTGHVLLEGILVAHTFGPWEEFSRPWGDQWRFLFLDTPLSVCIDRVNSRRAAAGKEPLADPKNIVRDHARINALAGQFHKAGRCAKYISHNYSIQMVLGVLNEY